MNKIFEIDTELGPTKESPLDMRSQYISVCFCEIARDANSVESKRVSTQKGSSRLVNFSRGRYRNQSESLVDTEVDWKTRAYRVLSSIKIRIRPGSLFPIVPYLRFF